MEWDLSDLDQVRDFFKQVRFGENGSKVTHFEQADGKRITIDEATDEQLLELGAQFGKEQNEGH